MRSFNNDENWMCSFAGGSGDGMSVPTFLQVIFWYMLHLEDIAWLGVSFQPKKRTLNKTSNIPSQILAVGIKHYKMDF